MTKSFPSCAAILLLAWLFYPSSSTKQTYIIHMDSTKISSLSLSLNGTKPWHEAILDSLIHLSPPQQQHEQHEEEESIDSRPELLYVYNTILSGFAATLSPTQAHSLPLLDGFLAVYPDDISTHLHTTHTPHFLSLTPNQGLWAPTNLASNVIIGVVDTGIWPEHVSFDDAHILTPPPHWKGTCEPGTNFTPQACNNKLIGARAFWKGYEAIAGLINQTTEYRSARDSQGHGTHTASTAAGNVVAGASLFGNARGSATGMRYTARVAAYKACWASGCASSDILAAVDRAVNDGVHVLSLSLGGSSRPYYSDTIAIAAFGAMQKGVVVSCSGGNSGPSESTVSNTAPWILTVAASYLDRSFPTAVKLGDGRVFTGASLYSGHPTKQLPIIYIDTPGARYCTEGSLSKTHVRGKIVICDRGINSRTEKGQEVKLAGGAGMLLANSEQQGEELFADPHVLPASSLGATAAEAIKAYLLTSKKATASITFQGTVYGYPAPMMTAFSSRGPSSVGPDVIKPDVTAPGMSILAAWPPSTSPTLLDSDQRRVDFNIISGTSMSCPHVSGLAALLVAVHRRWSPAAIKSALMTTGYVINNRNGSIMDVSTAAPATPFVFGSGHVDPERASSPGLVYDVSPREYLEYLCSLNYSSMQVSVLARRKYVCGKKRGRDLNYPSFSVLFDGQSSNATTTQTRTVTNVGGAGCRYSVSVREPEGVTVRVEPGVLVFRKVGEKMSYRVRFLSEGGRRRGYSFGEVVWVCGEFRVRSPVAVTWQ